MSEYPKQMRHRAYGRPVTVLHPPDIDSYQPYLTPLGQVRLESSVCFTPLPSPDDEVEVVVRMLRGAVERIAEGGWVSAADQVDLIDACRDHRDAEA